MQLNGARGKPLLLLIKPYLQHTLQYVSIGTAVLFFSSNIHCNPTRKYFGSAIIQP